MTKGNSNNHNKHPLANKLNFEGGNLRVTGWFTFWENLSARTCPMSGQIDQHSNSWCGTLRVSFTSGECKKRNCLTQKNKGSSLVGNLPGRRHRMHNISTLSCPAWTKNLEQIIRQALVLIQLINCYITSYSRLYYSLQSLLQLDGKYPEDAGTDEFSLQLTRQKKSE